MCIAFRWSSFYFLDLSLSQILDIFKLLTLTYPRYTDSGSQDAVEAVGIELVRRDELRGSDAGEQNEVKLGVAEQILGWLSHEVGRFTKNGNSKWVVAISSSVLLIMIFLCSSYAPSDLFVLLSWSCGLYTVCLKHNSQFTSSDPWKVLVGSMATLLDMIAESTKAKPALKKGALVRTRRAIRSVWSNSAFLVQVIHFPYRRVTKFLSWSVPFCQLRNQFKHHCVWCPYLMLPLAFWYASKMFPMNHLIAYLRNSRWVFSKDK